MLKQVTLAKFVNKGKQISNNATEQVDEVYELDEISEEENCTKELSLQVEEGEEAQWEVESSKHDTDDSNFTFPSCWNQKVWVSKKKQYPWLTCKNSKLGCTICRDLPSLGIHSKKSIHLSQEWQLCEVVANGLTREKQWALFITFTRILFYLILHVC